MSRPRGLSPEEAAVWRKVTETVRPLPGRAPTPLPPTGGVGGGPERAISPPEIARPIPAPAREREGPKRPPSSDWQRHGLDASWDKRLAKAQATPELSIDLHGLTLDQAHDRLLAALGQALARHVRVLLVIAGKARPHGEHDARGQRRGAIRAKLLDWLAASPHAPRIAAIRPAHPRHGGDGAVYVVLRRSR